MLVLYLRCVQKNCYMSRNGNKLKTKTFFLAVRFIKENKITQIELNKKLTVTCDKSKYDLDSKTKYILMSLMQ